MDSVYRYICGCEGLALAAAERDLFRARPPWGLILFKRNCVDPEQVRTLIGDFREIVGRADAPVLIDQEGGRVQRLGPPNWRAYPPAALFGGLYEDDPAAAVDLARLGARLIGTDLAELGITVDCLPLADLRFAETHKVIGDRAYAAVPETVAELARAVVDGLLTAGVLPVVKHIPGHGRATADSHLELPVVDTPRAELEETDFRAFAALADLPLAMTAHVVYRAIDPDRPATTSPIVIGDIVRRHIGFDGALMTDDLSMKALRGTIAERAAASVAAGCDLVLHCNGDLAEMQEVAASVPVLDGRAAERAEAALARIDKPAPLDIAAAHAEFDAALAAIG